MALLCEYTELQYNKNLIKEALDNTKEPLVLRDVLLQRANAKNQNGRVYPQDVLMREAKVYRQNFVDQRRALGELDHPESPVVNLRNVCCNVVGLWTDRDDIRGDVEILTTPTGNIVRELLRNGVKIGISSRGTGSVRQMDENTVEVQEDFSLICFDIVSNPSTIGAYINENFSSKIINPYTNVDKLIHDFLSEVK
jgi:hypothetical protein